MAWQPASRVNRESGELSATEDLRGSGDGKDDSDAILTRALVLEERDGILGSCDTRGERAGDRQGQGGERQSCHLGLLPALEASRPWIRRDFPASRMGGEAGPFEPGGRRGGGRPHPIALSPDYQQLVTPQHTTRGLLLATKWEGGSGSSG